MINQNNPVNFASRAKLKNIHKLTENPMKGDTKYFTNDSIFLSGRLI